MNMYRVNKQALAIWLIALAIVVWGIFRQWSALGPSPALVAASPPTIAYDPSLTPEQRRLMEKLVAAAIERTTHQVIYDPAYVKLEYPGGDVPADRGVCTDEVIRAYRQLGIDLQQDVHEDMKRHFALYPKKWGLLRPDPNIDHRRVPNLQVFFSRHGIMLPVTDQAADYRPGDLVTWDLTDDLPHIGIVTDRPGPSGNPLVVHNIGAGPQAEDRLFAWKITGHYRYFGRSKP